jgi:hypothetical protein
MYGNEQLVKAYKAGAQIAPCLIVKWDSVDLQVLPAAAATDKIAGVSVVNVTAPSGQRVDVIKAGIAQVQLGGTVTRGDPITSNASGLGVTAAPAAGVNNRIVGYAEISGVSGDIIPVLVNIDTIQG